MSKKPAALPHIEDATFAACLAPLTGSLAAAAGGVGRDGADGAGHAPAMGQRMPPGMAELADQARTQPRHTPGTTGAACSPQGAPPGATGACCQPGATGAASTRQALAAWRSLADQEYAEFCAIDRFLSRSDADLAAAVLQYPRQVRGFLARLMRIEHRRTAQQQAMAELIARIEMALIQAEDDPAPELPGAIAWGALPYPHLR